MGIKVISPLSSKGKSFNFKSYELNYMTEDISFFEI